MSKTLKPPPDYELELNADGIIRDANTGEHFGHVPSSLVALYSAAPELLAACEAMLKANYMPNSSMDIAVRARNAIAIAKATAASK